jgi:hypothetical protein
VTNKTVANVQGKLDTDKRSEDCVMPQMRDARARDNVVRVTPLYGRVMQIAFGRCTVVEGPTRR